MSVWWQMVAAKASRSPSWKMGLRTKTSGMCMPPSNGSFKQYTSPGCMRSPKRLMVAANASGNEVHASRRRVAAACPVHPESFRHPRPVREALGDDAEAHDLDGLVGPGPVPVRPLVLLPKDLRQGGSGAPVHGAPGHRHRQLE